MTCGFCAASTVKKKKNTWECTLSCRSDTLICSRHTPVARLANVTSGRRCDICEIYTSRRASRRRPTQHVSIDKRIQNIRGDGLGWGEGLATGSIRTSCFDWKLNMSRAALVSSIRFHHGDS